MERRGFLSRILGVPLAIGVLGIPPKVAVVTGSREVWTHQMEIEPGQSFYTVGVSYEESLAVRAGNELRRGLMDKMYGSSLAPTEWGGS